jgi:hypothetical protein
MFKSNNSKIKRRLVCKQDGRLEVHEIYGVDLTAVTNLVV